MCVCLCLGIIKFHYNCNRYGRGKKDTKLLNLKRGINIYGKATLLSLHYIRFPKHFKDQSLISVGIYLCVYLDFLRGIHDFPLRFLIVRCHFSLCRIFKAFFCWMQESLYYGAFFTCTLLFLTTSLTHIVRLSNITPAA